MAIDAIGGSSGSILQTLLASSATSQSAPIVNEGATVSPRTEPVAPIRYGGRAEHGELEATLRGVAAPSEFGCPGD